VVWLIWLDVLVMQGANREESVQFLGTSLTPHALLHHHVMDFPQQSPWFWMINVALKSLMSHR
jgi:hypothetical protein